MRPIDLAEVGLPVSSTAIEVFIELTSLEYFELACRAKGLNGYPTYTAWLKDNLWALRHLDHAAPPQDGVHYVYLTFGPAGLRDL